MHIRSLILAAVALVAFAGPTLAACRDFVQVTPDNAPVTNSRATPAGNSDDLDPRGARLGNCATIAADDPLNREGGYCEYARNLSSLSKPVAGVEYWITLNGVVPDIFTHQNGIISPINIPAIPLLGIPAIKKGDFVPLPGNAGKVKPGTCS